MESLESSKSPVPSQDPTQDEVHSFKIKLEGDTVLIGVKQLCPIVERHFDNISTVQWALLKEGHIDGETLITLADLITEIIQTSARDVLKILDPMLKKRVSDSQPLLSIKTVLGNALLKTITFVLGIKKKICKKTKELTEMIEQEIEQKVRKAIKMAVKMPKKARLSVTGCVSNLKRLNLMVKNIGHLLQNLVQKSRITQEWKNHLLPDSDYTDQSPPSYSQETDINFNEAVDHVIEILRDWTNCSKAVCEDTAIDITSALLMDMQTESKASTTVHPTVSVVMDIVKNFLASNSLVNVPRKNFKTFARRLFGQMLDGLNQEYINKCKELLLTGASESLEFLGQEMETDELDWDLILSHLLSLFDAIHQLEEPDRLNMESISSMEEIIQLSQILDKALSEYLIKKYENLHEKTEESKSESSKVLRSNARSAVKKFMHEVLLWITEELTSDLCLSDQVYEILSEIEELFFELLRKANKTEVSEKTSISSLSSDDEEDDDDEIEALEEGSDEEQEDEGPKDLTSSESTKDSYPETTNGSGTRSSESIKSSPKSVIWNDAVITGFLIMILSSHLKEKKKCKEAAEIRTLIKCLSNEVVPSKTSVIYKTIVVPENLKTIKTVLITKLQESFGTTEKLLQAASASPDSVVEVLVECVKQKMGIQQEVRKKGCFRRGLSRFATFMRKLF